MVSLTGAVLGSALIYMIPPYLYVKSTNRRMEPGCTANNDVVESRAVVEHGFDWLGDVSGNSWGQHVSGEFVFPSFAVSIEHFLAFTFYIED